MRIICSALSLLAAVTFAWLRFNLCYECDCAPWESLVDLSAGKPFVQRLLVPSIAALMRTNFGISIAQTFFVLECLSAWALVAGSARILSLCGSKPLSTFVGLGSLPVLLVAFCIITPLKVYFPSDTPAAAFLVWILVAGFERRRFLAAGLAVAGIFNRETAIWGPICLLLSTNPELKAHRLFWLLVLAAQLLCYLSLGMAFSSSPGESWQFIGAHDTLRLMRNLAWLSDPANLIQFLCSISWLPILVGWTWRQVPARCLCLLLTAGGLAGVSFVLGNVFEPRVLGEALILLYITWQAAIAVAQENVPNS